MLIADIRLGHPDSDIFVLDGWGPAEGGHRWTVGHQSRLSLPVADPGPDYVVVIHMAPWCDPVTLPAQTVMVAVNHRLLATVQFSDHRVLGWRLPAATPSEAETILSFSHVSSRLPRPAAGVDGQGLPLGVMVLSIRLFRLPRTGDGPQTRGPFPGSIADGVLPRAVFASTGLSEEQLAYRFEVLGHDCEFGLIQRRFGAEPISLLRFTGMTTYHLVDGLIDRFEGIGAPETTGIYIHDSPAPNYRVHERRYNLWYPTGRTPEELPIDAVLRMQTRRFALLQRKFVEDLRNGEKIYVVSRGECLAEPEALAIFCALNLEGHNTLLWAVHGDPDRAGQVDALMPGFHRGQLGTVDENNDGSPDAWLNLMANSYLLRNSENAWAHPVGLLPVSPGV